MNEFELIEHFFRQPPAEHNALVLGSGDDAAIIDVPAGFELAVSMDTLVATVHFFAKTTPEDIAYKAIAVNLSDMAAIGALPRWVMLSLTVPEKNIDWLKKFSDSFKKTAAAYDLVLIGGDLTKGPLAVSIAIHGLLPKGQALLRSGAKTGDLIYVTGDLGGAAWALQQANTSDKVTDAQQRLTRPDIRTDIGTALLGVATSCIDISDGLAADLKHIVAASGVGAVVDLAAIPYAKDLQSLKQEQAIELALAGGDDYELCFTLPNTTSKATLEQLNNICPIHCIGKMSNQHQELQLLDNCGNAYRLKKTAFQHFS